MTDVGPGEHAGRHGATRVGGLRAWSRDRLPGPLLRSYRAGRTGLQRLSTKLANAARAFRSDDRWYRLAIEQSGDFEIAYRRGTADELVLEESFDHDPNLACVPEYRLQPDHVVLDIGAHIGSFTLLVAARLPQGRVYAVEPQQDSFNLLRINVLLNGLENVDACRVALTDRRGLATLFYATRNWGDSLMESGTGRGETVPTETLAGFMASKGIDRCDFAKFNCEGAEFPILLSASPDVLGRIDFLLVRYHEALAPGYRLQDLQDHLASSGFRIRTRQEWPGMGYLVAERIGR
jgi:FkbM family methyltransferase